MLWKTGGWPEQKSYVLNLKQTSILSLEINGMSERCLSTRHCILTFLGFFFFLAFVHLGHLPELRFHKSWRGDFFLQECVHWRIYSAVKNYCIYESFKSAQFKINYKQPAWNYPTKNKIPSHVNGTMLGRRRRRRWLINVGSLFRWFLLE